MNYYKMQLLTTNVSECCLSCCADPEADADVDVVDEWKQSSVDGVNTCILKKHLC